MKRTLLILLAAAILLSLAAGLCGCGAQNTGLLYDADDLAGARMGVVAGTTYDAQTDEYIDNAEKYYFDDYADMAIALSQGKLDGFVMDEPMARMLVDDTPGLTTMDGLLSNDNYAFVLPKTERGAALREELNEYIRRIKTDGTADELDDIWMGTDESKKVLDYSDLTDINGTLTLVTSATSEPFLYYKDGAPVGYDLDIAARFCRERGYALNTVVVDGRAVLEAISSGKGDMAAECITVTEERMQSVYFSDTTYAGGIVVVIRADRKGGGGAKYTSLSQLEGKKIGVVTGTMMDVIATDNIPGCTAEYYQNSSDLKLALMQGKIDAYTADEPNARYMCAADPENIVMINEFLANHDYGFGFAKTERGEKLRDEMNEYLTKIRADGTLAKIDADAFNTDDATQPVYDLPKPDGPNGNISLLIFDTNVPFGYVLKGDLVGYELDVVYGFCREYGYGLTVDSCEFAALIPGVQKYDIVSGGITITQERSESIHFSDPYYNGGLVAVVAANSGAQSTPGFFESVALSFEKNFIREDRWKMVLSGLGVTLLISVTSAALGTAVGFGICMLRRARRKWLARIAAIFIRIIQGTPVVVLLMIIYYVVFADSTIDAIYVAIIGFSINFGVYVAEMMRMGIDAVPAGQTEAARALGFNKYRTFQKVVFPQAAKHFLPVYQGEFISMVKMTSVVGYIAIQDLTKVSDIIRSRTYEAFFPLIATAVIYFLISYAFVFLLTRLEVRIDPKRRRRRAARTESVS